MKLDNLITQYLYNQKRVSLPGIGTFTTDGPAVKFENQYDLELSKDLIEFVKTHTGKMYSLAQSDLESYIMLNKQFLNIGKALHVEGIGTLVKTKEGLFDFTPGEMVPERMEDLTSESRKPSAFIDETRYQPENNSRQKWFIALLSILTLVIIVWGGWRLFVNNAESSKMEIRKVSETNSDSNSSQTNSQIQNYTITDTQVDSSGGIKHEVSAGNKIQSIDSSWKFIIETTTNKQRALRRYKQLIALGSGIKIATTDSLNYKLYFTIIATTTDTLKIKDSLKRVYDSKNIVVEK